MKILIVPVGAVDLDIVKDIASKMKNVFRCDVAVSNKMDIPQDAYDSGRKQYYSTTILKKMQVMKQKDFARMLGIIDVDLYVPELNFVFGEADISTGTAIIALTRLREEFYGHRPDKGLFLERALKEAVHEIGHTFGLGHCLNPKCIMYFSNGLRDTDIKGPGFCNKCKTRLGI
jgi:archaemetzincin